jgi:hypothetical protein
MSTSDQDQLFEVLEEQKRHQLRVDRVLKNRHSCDCIFTCCDLRQLKCLVDCFQLCHHVDCILCSFHQATSPLALGHCHCTVLFSRQYFTYGNYNQSGFSRQFGAMFIFLGVFGVGRRYFDRWSMNKGKL